MPFPKGKKPSEEGKKPNRYLPSDQVRLSCV